MNPIHYLAYEIFPNHQRIFYKMFHLSMKVQASAVKLCMLNLLLILASGVMRGGWLWPINVYLVSSVQKA